MASAMTSRILNASDSPVIANIMLGRGLGGLEQAFLDYDETLRYAGYTPCPIMAHGAQSLQRARSSGLEPHLLKQYGAWDIFAARRLRTLLLKHKVEAVIAHGNRALVLAHRAVGGRIPIITVSHNYNLQHAHKADAMLATTHDLAQHSVLAGLSNDKIFLLPNMVRLPDAAPRTHIHTPPVIGAMGRMVPKKGFDVFIRALSILRAYGVQYSAVLAGDGPEKPMLEALIKELNLEKEITLTGWVEFPPAFYQTIDMFCLPSQHEPFGIVVLEAGAYSLPIVSTATEGPREILADPSHGALVPINDPEAMAHTLAELCNQPEKALLLGKNARQLVAEKYDLPVVAKTLGAILRKILHTRA